MATGYAESRVRVYGYAAWSGSRPTALDSSRLMIKWKYICSKINKNIICAMQSYSHVSIYVLLFQHDVMKCVELFIDLLIILCGIIFFGNIYLQESQQYLRNISRYPPPKRADLCI